MTATQWWGVGQPAVVSLDGKGELLLFYTRGDAQGTRTLRRKILLLNTNAPVLGAELELPVAGLKQLSGSAATVNHGGALVHDVKRDLYWLIRPGHPFPQDCPDFISSQL